MIITVTQQSAFYLVKKNKRQQGRYGKRSTTEQWQPFILIVSAHREVERAEMKIRYTGLVFLIYIKDFGLAIAK